jgi:hypothetical protein
VSHTAWPHQRPQVTHEICVVQLARPIGFDAPDEQPVGLLIFLLVPEASTEKHLEILSEIAELLSATRHCAGEIKTSPRCRRARSNIVATWNSGGSVKPTAISADVLFEAFRGQLRWQWLAGLGASERALRRKWRSARCPSQVPTWWGTLKLHPPFTVHGCRVRREIAYLTNSASVDCLRSYLPHRHA